MSCFATLLDPRFTAPSQSTSTSFALFMDGSHEHDDVIKALLRLDRPEIRRNKSQTKPFFCSTTRRTAGGLMLEQDCLRRFWRCWKNMNAVMMEKPRFPGLKQKSYLESVVWTRKKSETVSMKATSFRSCCMPDGFIDSQIIVRKGTSLNDVQKTCGFWSKVEGKGNGR